jgi:hypothetical protein
MRCVKIDQLPISHELLIVLNADLPKQCSGFV